MMLSKKGKQKYVILKLIFLGLGLFLPFLARTQALDSQAQAQQADSLERLQAYGSAAAIYTKLGVLAEEEKQVYRSAQRHLQAAECWLFEDPNEMYMSLSMADSMFTLSEHTPDTLAANIANSWGKLYFRFGYPEEAKAYYEQSLNLRQKILPSDHKDLMGSYNNLGLLSYFYDDDYRQALIFYRRALRIAAQNAHVPNVWLARLHANFARTFSMLDMQDSVDLALARALTFYQAEGLKATHTDVIDLQLEICRSRIGRADFTQAELMLADYANRLQDESLPLASRKKLPSILEMQGDLYKAKRDWQRAKDAYLRAQTSYEKYPADNPIEAFQLPQRLAEIALLQGDLEESEKLYRNILKEADRLDQATVQLISLNLSQLYQLMDRPDEIRKILQNLPNPENLDAFDHSRYFLMQARLSEGKEAEDLYQKAAKQMRRASSHHPQLSSLYWEIANWYRDDGQSEGQAKYLELALHANLREGDNEILSLPQQVINLSSMGRYLQDQKPDLALNLYVEADSLLSLLGRYYPAEESRAVLRGNLSDFYADAIALLFAGKAVLRDAERLEQAYQLVEKSRANLLRERQQELAIFEQALAPALQDSLWEAQSRLAHLRNQWFAADSIQKLPLKSRIATAKEACLRWNEQLAVANPDYYALKYEPSIPSLDQLEQHLAEGEYLINYFVAGEEIYAFFVARGERLGLKLGSKALRLLPDFLTLLQSVEPYYANGALVEKQYAETAYQLYQSLVEPFLRDRAKPKLLWLIPDGALGYLPFETLLTTEVAADDDFRSFPYLLKSCPIRYTYYSEVESISKNTNSLAYAGFAPIYQAQGTEPGVLRSSPLQNLAWARKEVLEAQTIFGGEAYVDDAATEQRLLDLETWPAVLHFSMHALVDDQEPLNSRLAFSPTEAHGDLMLYEIYQLPIESQLAVLSACNTGQGPLYANEGIVSLARAFRYAGCPSVLASLWLVDEKASYDIHAVYFQAMADKLDKASALQQAKLAYLDQADSKVLAHPFYWASLVQIGSAEPLVIKQNLLQIGYLLGGLLVITIGLGIWYRRLH